MEFLDPLRGIALALELLGAAESAALAKDDCFDAMLQIEKVYFSLLAFRDEIIVLGKIARSPDVNAWTKSLWPSQRAAAAVPCQEVRRT